jgi:NADH:ubiquinone reductase (H+-translocating)
VFVVRAVDSFGQNIGLRLIALGSGNSSTLIDLMRPDDPGRMTGGRVLLAFEEAERRARSGIAGRPPYLRDLGTGPTGVELAGTIAELARTTLPPDFRNTDTLPARTILIEAGPGVTAGYPDDLARRPCGPVRRVAVLPDLTVPGPSRVLRDRRYGDGQSPSRKALWRHSSGRKQGEGLCRPVIMARLKGVPTVPFVYKHQGSLAQIGKRRAIFDFGRIKLAGAGMADLGVGHIYFLIGPTHD